MQISDAVDIVLVHNTILLGVATHRLTMEYEQHSQ